VDGYKFRYLAPIRAGKYIACTYDSWIAPNCADSSC